MKIILPVIGLGKKYMSRFLKRLNKKWHQPVTTGGMIDLQNYFDILAFTVKALLMAKDTWCETQVPLVWVGLPYMYLMLVGDHQRPW